MGILEIEYFCGPVNEKTVTLTDQIFKYSSSRDKIILEKYYSKVLLILSHSKKKEIMITVFQKFIRKNLYLITYEALTSKPLIICNFCFGYLLIRYYRSLMLNIDEIRDIRVRNLEILFTFLYSSSYICCHV